MNTSSGPKAQTGKMDNGMYIYILFIHTVFCAAPYVAPEPFDPSCGADALILYPDRKGRDTVIFGKLSKISKN